MVRGELRRQHWSRDPRKIKEQISKSSAGGGGGKDVVGAASAKALGRELPGVLTELQRGQCGLRVPRAEEIRLALRPDHKALRVSLQTFALSRVGLPWGG